GPSVSTYRDIYCAGTGWVRGSVEQGGATQTSEVVSVDDRVPASAPDHPAIDSNDVTAGPSGAPKDWTLTRVGSALPSSFFGSATVPPVYLPTDPPTVAVSTDAGGDLVALGIGEVRGTVSWRFPTAGAIFSEPRV